MSFGKYIHHHNQRTVLSHQKMFLQTPLLSTPSPNPTPTTDLLSVPMVLPFLECHRNGITEHAVFCVELLSLRMIPLRFIDAVAWSGLWFLFITEQYSIAWTYCLLFIHLPLLFLGFGDHKSAENLHIQAFGGHVFISLESEIMRACSKHVFNLIRNSLYVLYLHITSQFFQQLHELGTIIILTL